MQGAPAGFDHFVRNHYGSRISDAELRQRVNHPCIIPPLEDAFLRKRWDIAEHLLRHYGANAGGLHSLFTRNEKHISLLIRYGAPVNVMSPVWLRGRRVTTTALIWTYETRSPACALILLNHGADYRPLLLHSQSTSQLGIARRRILAHVRTIQAREQRARLACYAVWATRIGLPRDMQRMLMRYVWNERRNEAWDFT